MRRRRGQTVDGLMIDVWGILEEDRQYLISCTCNCFIKRTLSGVRLTPLEAWNFSRLFKINCSSRFVKKIVTLRLNKQISLNVCELWRNKRKKIGKQTKLRPCNHLQNTVANLKASAPLVIMCIHIKIKSIFLLSFPNLVLYTCVISIISGIIKCAIKIHVHINECFSRNNR